MAVKKKRKCCQCCCCCLHSSPETDEEDNACAESAMVVTSTGALQSPSNILMQKEHVYQKEQTKCDKCIKCFKKTVTFFFSNIGLCALVVAYSILGGFIFKELEAPNELLKKHSVIFRRRQYVVKLWNMTKEYNILHEVIFYTVLLCWGQLRKRSFYN